MLKNQVAENYYTSQARKLLKDFDKYTRKHARKTIASNYGDHVTDTLLREGRQEYEALIPELPYIGGKKNRLTANLIASAWCLALYRVLKTRGKTAEEVGTILHESVEAQLRSYPRFVVRLVGRWMFAKFRLKKYAAESQKRRYPEDWVCSFIQGDGKQFDFGIDYTECAICKFFHAQGAGEFTPFLCLLDFPMSKAMGTGLVRTMTLAEGAEKCDFRFKRGREVREVKQGWPPESLKQNKT